MPVIAMRVDAGSRLGWGHLVRCRSLALALRKRNVSVGFITGSDGLEAGERLVQDGFAVSEFRVLSDKYLKQLPMSDAALVTEVARKWHASIILVDHYGATSAYMGHLANNFKVAVIDDCADRDLSSVSWLLNQNLDAEKLPYKVATGTELLCGSSFALLRPEFMRMRQEMKRGFTAGQQNVLLSFGGGDNADLTQAVLRDLVGVPVPLHVRALCGAASDAVRKSLPLELERLHHIEILGAVDNIHEHMAWADIAINAGGSTCWELCCLGVPMIIMTLADNQRGNAAALAKKGCAVHLGEVARGIPPVGLWKVAQSLLVDYGRRRTMSERSMTIVDSYGSERVAESLLSLTAREMSL